MQIQPETPSSCPGALPGNLRDEIAKSEKELAEKRRSLDSWRQAEVDLERTTQDQLKTLNDLAKADGRYRKIRKFTPFTGIGAFPLVGVSAVLGAPALFIAAAVVTLGSMALHQYSLKRDREIDDAFNPLKEEYDRSAVHMESLRRNRVSLEHEVNVRERELGEMKKSVADFTSMVRAAQSPEPAGIHDVQDRAEKIIVDGVSLRKNIQR